MENSRGNGPHPIESDEVSRRAAIGSVLIGGAVAALFAQERRSARAQEGTPVVTQGVMGDEVTYEQIDFGTANVLPPAPATINFFHVRFAPGASFAGSAEDPSLGPHLVESGTLTLRGFTADIVIHRADGEEEVVSAGAEASLGPGDLLVWEPHVGGEIANDGTEPVMYYTVNIAPVDAATPQASEMAATPAA